MYAYKSAIIVWCVMVIMSVPLLVSACNRRESEDQIVAKPPRYVTHDNYNNI